MSPVIMIIGGALELAIICVSVYGAVTLAPGARVPVHWAGSYNQWLPKNIGLAIWPALGIVVLVIILVGGHSRHVHGSPTVGLSVVLGVMLVAQIGALARARRRGNSL